MNILVPDDLVHKLERVAAQRQQPVEIFIENILREHLEAAQENAQFTEDIRAIIRKRKWLFDELEKR